MSSSQHKALFTSNDQSWATPKSLFDYLNKRFHFTLDPCCTVQTALCQKYYTEEDDGLSKDWSDDVVFMNPPYGRDISSWIRKAYEESCKGALVVGLIPARVDTSWWHNYVVGKAHVLFIRGRLRFSGATQPAPFPAAIVIWWGGDAYGPL